MYIQDRTGNRYTNSRTPNYTDSVSVYVHFLLLGCQCRRMALGREQSLCDVIDSRRLLTSDD